MNHPTSTQADGLVCSGLTKRYGGIAVVRDFDISLTPGQVVGLVGENGAGKSTTSSMIAGMVQPDEGRMTIDGEAYEPKSPADALAAGVVLIHQEIKMVQDLSVAENVFLGRLPVKGGRLDRAEINERTAEALRALGSKTDPRRPVRGLSMAAQQEIEIARAITRNPRFIIFDEPSASLGESETARVFEQIDVLRSRGAGIVYISHRLEEITRLSDSIVCLRDGHLAARWDTGDVPREDIVRAMVGRDFSYGHEEPLPHGADIALSVRGLERAGAFTGVNFDVRKGEILGVAGLIGAGRTEMVRTIAGADRATAGTITVDGSDVVIRSPRDGIANGIAMVPEDRKGQGLGLQASGVENMTMPWEAKLMKGGIVRNATLEKIAKEQVEFLDIRGRVDIPVGRLSGGNQQKVLFAKWLIERPEVLILDEPTRGVDVGAKMTIYSTIRKLAEEGVAIIVVSSELEEVLGLAHRVLVMAGGKQQVLLDRGQATPEAVMKYALGEPGDAEAPAAAHQTSNPDSSSTEVKR